MMDIPGESTTLDRDLWRNQYFHFDFVNLSDTMALHFAHRLDVLRQALKIVNVELDAIIAPLHTTGSRINITNKVVRWSGNSQLRR